MKGERIVPVSRHFEPRCHDREMSGPSAVSEFISGSAFAMDAVFSIVSSKFMVRAIFPIEVLDER